MSKQERNGQRKSRAQLSRHRSPELGYYIIVTDTEETEQNYMYGLRDSMESSVPRDFMLVSNSNPDYYHPFLQIIPQTPGTFTVRLSFVMQR